ncbi:hypothetical protein FAI41_05490 [Acetobacteraceae bacterium]|nr:hypothetical protein FAI41_05490 [Acetobacteraceae bacterium]
MCRRHIFAISVMSFASLFPFERARAQQVWSINSNETIGPGDAHSAPDGVRIADAGPSSTGSLTITGKGASLTATLSPINTPSPAYTIGVGVDGTGVLNIENGGSAIATGVLNGGQAGQIWAGAREGSNGTINVTGPGSSMSANSRIDVGVLGNGTLNITNGGEVTGANDNLYLGLGFNYWGGANANAADPGNGQGIVNVDGKDSLLDISGQGKIGYYDKGTLNITNGGSAILNGMTVAENKSAQGSAVKIDDAALKVTAGATIGNGGMGSLTAHNKATAIFDSGLIIADTKAASGSSADINNSKLNVTGDTVIGNQGQGLLTIENGSSTTLNGGLSVANAAGSDGSKVDVNKATLTVSGDAENKIGNSAKGLLSAENGAIVNFTNTKSLVIAANAGSEGSTVHLDDAALTVSGSGRTVVGQGAMGSLTAENKATATFGSGLTIADTKAASGSSADINNSKLNVTGDTVIGNQGQGLLTIENGSATTLNGGLSVANAAGSDGSKVDVNKATLTVSGDAESNIGNSAKGLLSAENGAIVNFTNTKSLVIAANTGSAGSAMDLDDSTLNIENNNQLGSVTIGSKDSDGSLNLSNKATANILSTNVFVAHGSLNLDNSTATISKGGNLILAEDSGSSATVNLTDNAILTEDGDITAGAGSSKINVGNAADKGNSTLNIGGNVMLASGGKSSIALDNGVMNFTGAGSQKEALDVSLADQSIIGVTQKSASTLLSGVVSGAEGLLRKTGLGELILGNDNSYADGTEIDSGTLTGHVNQDGSGSFSTGNIAEQSGSTLQIAQNKDGDFKNTLSGAGDLLINAKGGTISLSGDESQHTGKTLVNEGGATLSSATSYGGGFDIATGGILSGLGSNGTATIKGDLNNNGQLIVGSGDAKQTGTLTVDGNLFLAGGSKTTWAESTATDVNNAGLASATAGNDLINVTGNVALGDKNGDAVINVKSALANSADLGPGAYRLINYGGSLTSDMAKLGTVSVGADQVAVIETGVDKEVNLLITDATTKGYGNIWNGGAATSADGTSVVGGSGTWSNSDLLGSPSAPSSVSWAGVEKDGSKTFHDSWAGANPAGNTDGYTAIFQGQGGTVTISDTTYQNNDNGQQTEQKSQVKAAGLDFGADGYTLKGDALSDNGNGMTIRVGDGQSDGAKYTANIDNQLLTHAITKTDSGTLNLNSDGNVATTGIDVEGGTMNLNGKDNQFGGISLVGDGDLLNTNGAGSLGTSNLRIYGGGQADIALQSLSDQATITDEGRLDIGGTQNNAKSVWNESGTLGNTLSGGGVLNKFGTGNIAMTGNNDGFTGQTQVNNGTLDFNGGNMSHSAVLVDAGGVADGDVVQKSATLTAEDGASAKSITLADTATLKDGSQTSNHLVAAGLTVADNVTVGSGDSATLNKANNGSSLDIGSDLDVAVNGGKNATVTLNDGSSLKAGGNIALGNAVLNAENASISSAKNLVMGGDLTQSGKNTTVTANLSGTSLDVSNSMALNNGSLTADKGSKITAGGTAIVGSGKSNDAKMNVKGGSSLSAGNLVLGSNSGTGTLNLSDNSRLKIAGQTIVGMDGTGTINVGTNLNPLGGNKEGKAFVMSAADSSSLTLGNNTILAQNAGSSGTINMYEGTILNASGQIVHGDGTANMSFTNASLNATGDLRDDVDTSLSGQNTINTNSNNIDLDSKLSGDGGFDKTGSGILQIDNKNNSYTGATNIQQGILQGVGTIGGDLNMASGTTLRAGMSSDPSVQYGKMQVNGNTIMQDGSTLTSYVGGSGNNLQSGQIYDKGIFTIGRNNTTLDIHAAPGSELAVNQDYEIVHADGGVNGKFSNYNQNGTIGGSGAYDYGTLYTLGPYYTEKDVQIKWLFDSSKGLGWGGDRNQTGTAQRLSPSVDNPNSPLHGIASILAGSDNEQRLYNLTQMDGEIASDMRTGNINNNFWVRDSVNNRLDCLEDTFRQIGDGKATNSNVCGVTGKKVNVWGNMYGGLGGQNGHSGWDYAAKTRDNEAGFIWGVDGEIGSEGYAEDRWHVGMMMGYGSVMESASGVSSSGESNNANIGMYFGKQVRFDNQNFFTFHGQFGYTWNIMSWHRSVDLQGAAAQYNQSLHANELGGTAHINAEIAYKHVFNLWGTPLELAPTGSITYLNYEQGSYHETGGNLALHGAATNTNLGYGFMGAKIATNFNIGNVVITPHGKFGYRRSFGANQSYTHTGFEALGGGTDGLSIVGVPVVQDQALTELGFDVHPTEYLSFGANYVGLYGGHSQTMSGGQLSAKIAF